MLEYNENKVDLNTEEGDLNFPFLYLFVIYCTGYFGESGKCASE